MYPRAQHAAPAEMPETTETPAALPAILHNARVKSAAKLKVAHKIRKARPLKNLDLTVLHGRLLEIQKRVRTAECKITLLKEKLVVHEDELTARVDVPVETASA